MVGYDVNKYNQVYQNWRTCLWASLIALGLRFQL